MAAPPARVDGEQASCGSCLGEVSATVPVSPIGGSLNDPRRGIDATRGMAAGIESPGGMIHATWLAMESNRGWGSGEVVDGELDSRRQRRECDRGE